MAEKKPQPILPFAPDCIADVMGEAIPARYLQRCRDTMAAAWIQTAEGVFTTAVIDLKRLPP